MAQAEVINAAANDDGGEGRIERPRQHPNELLPSKDQPQKKRAGGGASVARLEARRKGADPDLVAMAPRNKLAKGELIRMASKSGNAPAGVEMLPLGSRRVRQDPRAAEKQLPPEPDSGRNGRKSSPISLPIVESFAETLSQLSSARRLNLEIEWIEERQLCLTGRNRRLTLDFHNSGLPFDCLMITPLADTPRPGRQRKKPGLITRCLAAVGFGAVEDDILDPIQIELRQRVERRKPGTRIVPFDHDRLGGPALLSGTYIDRDRKRKWFFELYASDRASRRKKSSRMSEHSAKRAMRATLAGLEFALRRRS